MSSVDQRVVQMQFDNAQFEAGIRQSQRTLQAFDKSLQSENGTKGLSKIGEAVDTVKERFSALGIAGATVIANLTNSAVNFAKRLASEFTIEPIKQGLQEYELQMQSVQTIMANTDRPVQDVNASLDDLNTYADKTIYNFAEMTSNIGRFTAAGVGLEDSQAAIKGIANLAALSGSNSQQASSAMYQLSQAIASGRVNLMDWNSVVNAGMGGTKFQEALKRTGRAMGAVIDDSKSFRESISGSDTWLTGEILLETLKQISGGYTDAELAAQGYTEEQIADIQKMAKVSFESATVVKTFTQLVDTLKEAIGSGWAQSFRTIIGDFEEAKELWTGVNNILSDMVGKSADARNAMLQTWKDQGGRDAIISAVSEAWEGLVSIMGTVKQAFQDVFPPMTGERLAEISKQIKNGATAFKEWATNSQTLSTVKTLFTGLFSAVKIGINIVQGFGRIIGTFVLPALKPLGTILVSVASAIARFFTAIANGMPSGDAFQKILDDIKSKLGPVGEVLGNAVQAIKGFFDNLGKAGDGAKGPDMSFIDGFVGKVKEIANTVKTTLAPVAEGIKNFFQPIIDQIQNVIGSMQPIDWATLFATGGLAAVMAAITKFVHSFDKIFGSVSDLFDELKESLTGGDGIVDKFKGVFDVLQAYQNQLNAQAIRNIAISVGILAASMFVLAAIPSDKLVGSVAGLAAAVGILVGAMALLALIDKKMSVQAGSISSMSVSLVALSISIAILASALKSISEVSGPDLLKGVAALAALAMITSYLAETTAKFKDQKGLIAGAIAMALFAVSMKELSKSVAELGALPLDQLAKGLGGVLALMGILVAFVNGTAKSMGSQGVSAGLGIMAVAAALLIMSKAVAIFASMDLAAMAQGLVGVGASMAILAAGLIAVGRFSQGSMGAATGMVIAAAAMVVLAQAVKAYGSLPMEQVAQGLIALGGSMAILVVGLNLMKGTIAGAAAMLVAAAAINVLVPAVLALGSADTMAVVQGLVALAAAMAIMGVAGYALAGAVPGMLGLAAAMALIGASVFLVGAGISALAAGVTVLAAAGTAGAASFVASLTIIVTGLAALIPTVAAALAQALAAFISTLASSAGTIASAVATLVSKILSTLSTLIPQLVSFGLEMIVALLTGIRDNMKQIASTALEIIAEFINGLAEGIPAVIDAGMNFVVSLIEGIADGISENAQRIADAMRDLADSLIEAFCTVLGIASPSTVFQGFGGDILTGLVNGITGAVGSVIRAIANVGSSIISAIGDFISQIPAKGMELITNLANGISSAVGNAVSAASGVVSNVLSTVGGFVGQFLSAGSQLIQSVGSGISNAASAVSSAVSGAIGAAKSAASSAASGFSSIGSSIASGIASGINAGISWVSNAVSSIISAAKSTARNEAEINSPSKLFARELGSPISEGVAYGIVKNVGYVNNAMKTLVKDARVSAQSLADDISSYLSDDPDFRPTITPVLDMTDVIGQSRNISSLLGTNRSYQLAAVLSGSAGNASSRGSSYVDSHNRTVNQTNHITFPEGLDNVYEAIDYMVSQLNINAGLEG